MNRCSTGSATKKKTTTVMWKTHKDGGWMAGGREMPAGEMKPGFCRDTPMREVTSGSKTNTTPQISPVNTTGLHREILLLLHLPFKVTDRADVLTFYELWLKHNQTVAPTLNGSLTTTAKRLIRSPMQSRRLKLHLTAAFVTMAQMCNVKELTWWVTTHSSHLYSMF